MKTQIENGELFAFTEKTSEGRWRIIILEMDNNYTSVQNILESSGVDDLEGVAQLAGDMYASQTVYIRTETGPFNSYEYKLPASGFPEQGNLTFSEALIVAFRLAARVKYDWRENPKHDIEIMTVSHLRKACDIRGLVYSPVAVSVNHDQKSVAHTTQHETWLKDVVFKYDVVLTVDCEI